MNKDYILANLSIFGLLSSLVLPFINVFGFGLYLTTFISFVIMLSLLFYSIKINYSAILIFFICISVFVSILYSNALGYTTHSFSNYLEVYKYFQYIPYLVLFSSLKKKPTIKNFTTQLYLAVLIYLLVFFLQFFNPLNLGYKMSAYSLGADSGHLFGIETGLRLPITGADPNVGAAIGLFFIIIFLCLYAQFKKTKDFILFVLCFISIFFPQSRTSLIALVLVLAVFVLLSKVKITYKAFFLIVFSIVTYVSFNYMQLEYITSGFNSFQEGDNGSFNARVDNISLATEAFRKSPILGIGPAKNEIDVILDSEYILIFLRYGILGAVSFFSFILYMMYKGYSNIKHAAGLGLLLYTLSTLVIMVTNNAYSGYQLMSANMLLIVMLDIMRNNGVRTC